MAYNMKSEEEVRDFLDNLATEYSFSCLHEKSAVGCDLLGDYLSVIKKNYKGANEIYRDNCDQRKFAHSCFKYAKQTFLGQGCKENVDEALKYFEKGCHLNNADACLHGGLMLASTTENIGHSKIDIVEGLKFFNKACDANLYLGCYHASSIYMKGSAEIPQNMDKGLELCRKSCELGYANACMTLSQMYKKGKGVEMNQTLAREFRNMAVELRSHIKSDKSKVEFQQYT